MKRYGIFFLMGMLFFGSSVFAVEAADPASATPKGDPSGERMVSLDFDNVDIPVMVKFISELTGKNFVIDEQVRGKVTIFSPMKIPASKAYDVFISVLEMKGFIVVPAGVVYQILPFASYPPSRSMHLYTLQNTVAEEVSQTLTSLVSRATQPMRPKSKPSDEISGPVQIVTEKITNQLIITASDDDYQIIEKTIKSLDKKKRQVYVEAVVMEMAADKTREIGSDISAIFGGVSAPRTGFSFLGDLNGGLSQASSLIGAAAVGTTPATNAVTGIVPGFGLRPINARTFLKALQTSKDVNVLSTPQLLTSDKQKAELSVAQNVPFPGATNNVAGGGQTVTVERKDVGVILRMTPTIMENSQVKLELYQEISSVIDSGDKTLGPTTSKRFASTTVVVKDGQTTVIGGLLGDTVIVTEKKIPLLGDIPILGYLFKFKTKRVEKTNLLIFVTPHIVPDGEDKEASDSLLQEKVNGALKFMNENKLGELVQREDFLKGMVNQPK